jgi:hypothetical protein
MILEIASSALPQLFFGVEIDLLKSITGRHHSGWQLNLLYTAIL